MNVIRFAIVTWTSPLKHLILGFAPTDLILIETLPLGIHL
jgi:hypothetical protein